MQSKKVKKEVMLKFEIISRTCLNFMIVSMGYEKRSYIDVRYENTYPKKKTKPKATRRVFKLDS